MVLVTMNSSIFTIIHPVMQVFLHRCTGILLITEWLKSWTLWLVSTMIHQRGINMATQRGIQADMATRRGIQVDMATLGGRE